MTLYSGRVTQKLVDLKVLEGYNSSLKKKKKKNIPTSSRSSFPRRPCCNDLRRRPRRLFVVYWNVVNVDYWSDSSHLGRLHMVEHDVLKKGELVKHLERFKEDCAVISSIRLDGNININITHTSFFTMIKRKGFNHLLLGRKSSDIMFLLVLQIMLTVVSLNFMFFYGLRTFGAL